MGEEGEEESHQAKVARWTWSVNNVKSKAEMQRLAKEMNIRSSNDIDVLIERIKNSLRSQDLSAQAERDELTLLLKEWSLKKVEELVSKREICLYLFFKLKERHQFQEENLETIQVRSPNSSLVFLMMSVERIQRHLSRGDCPVLSRDHLCRIRRRLSIG